MSSRETLFGDIPNDWTLATIGDIAELRQGLQISKELRISEKKDGYIPLLKITDLPKKVFSEYVTDIKEQYIANYNDIIYTRTGQVGLVYTDTEGCIHNNCFKVIVDFNHFDKYFIYYYLKSNKVFNYSNSVASGSVQKDLKHSAFKSCVIGYPNIVEQRSIGHILSTLDDKFKINNQINKTLENMAQTIFKQWFVDFEFPNEDGEPYKSSGGEMVESELGLIPKGWEVGTLNDVIDFQNGYAFKSKDLLDENIGNCYHVFKMGHINKGGGLNKDGTKSYVLKKDYEDLSRYILKKGDLLMCMTDMKSNVALLGHTALMDEDNKYILNQRVGLLRIKDEKKLDYPFIYVLTNSNDFLESLRSRANSGVQVNLSTKEIKESQLIIPGEKTHELFNNIAKALFEEYFNLGKENDQLISLRDALLPKLMSGEIRVPLDEEGDAS